MRIVVHVDKFYDWEPVPPGVRVTTADIASLRVKPATGGGYLMRVTRTTPSHTQVNLPESQILAKIIHEKTRPEGGRVLSRRQAVAFYLSEEVMPHHAARGWMTGFEVHDDGPSEPLARSMLDLHVKAGTIKAEELEDHIGAYMEAADSAAHAAHLAVHFGIQKTAAKAQGKS